MKDKKTKNHKENWIGNIIRGFLLFMPLLAIGVTCAYAIFNKNAYQSYADNSAENTYIYNTQNIDINKEYYLVNGYKNTYDGLDGNASNNNITISIIEVIDNPSNINFTNVNRIGFYSPQGTSYNIGFYLNYTDGTSTLNITSGNTWKIKIQILSYSNNFTSSLDKMNILYENGNNNSISNVFYYSIDKVQQSPLFNWSTDTGMYNVIHGACTTIGIESTFIPFLLAYWLLTYLIYIIYDIALLIVNMAHNRIHDVESSI